MPIPQSPRQFNVDLNDIEIMLAPAITASLMGAVISHPKYATDRMAAAQDVLETYLTLRHIFQAGLLDEAKRRKDQSTE